MPLLTILGMIPTILSIVNGVVTIFHNPSNAETIQAITTSVVAVATSFGIHGAVSAHAKADANTKKIEDSTKPGHQTN